MSELRVEEHGHVRLVVFDNPPVNAMSPEWDIQGTFDAITADEDARVVVLTGQGDRVFCAGADIKAAARGDRAVRPERTNSRDGRENFYSIMECAVPVIGAINGPALGAGPRHRRLVRLPHRLGGARCSACPRSTSGCSAGRATRCGCSRSTSCG